LVVILLSWSVSFKLMKTGVLGKLLFQIIFKDQLVVTTVPGAGDVIVTFQAVVPLPPLSAVTTTVALPLISPKTSSTTTLYSHAALMISHFENTLTHWFSATKV